MRRPKVRIGVFGGTFDPPHLGHLILAEEIRERFDLREVYFMPCRRPPHKDRPNLTDATHRFAMVVAATAQNPAFVASPLEVNRPGISYSIDTLHLLQDELGGDTDILFVAGLDSFLEIETWKDYEALLDLCHFIVVSRPGNRFDEIPDRMPESVQGRIVDLRGDGADPEAHLGAPAETSGRREERDRVGEGGEGAEGSPEAEAEPEPVENAPDEATEGGRWRIFLSDAVTVDIASTEIRDRVRNGRSIRYRVPAEVERYIRTHGLYRDTGAREAAS